ncbi:MAG: phytanoyl-CoA dioxygenase family protein [Acidobacteria bacterium]|nr:phytanoyl-CoA dioxygenase family protein [Acidobacteriota bacterium]MBI3428388.1 phytanoyl-CoA dioxygenase family protein [Acidobacteriota bacterium]
MENSATFVPVPTPDPQDIHSQERDLRFHPSTTVHPRKLTSAQITKFNTDGFLTGITIFGAQEINEIRLSFDNLLAQYFAAGKDSYAISTAHMRHGKVYDLLTHPRIVAYVKDILGENVSAWGSHFFCKMPRDGKKVSWHQDATYWPLSPSKAITVWLAIDDANVENACVRFIPGSHHHGELTANMHENDESEVLYQSVAAAENFGEPFDNILQAGQISLHSDLLLHGSKANESDRRRCGLTLRYCTADVTAYLDWHAKGILVSGVDPRGHWANPPRPVED